MICNIYFTYFITTINNGNKQSTCETQKDNSSCKNKAKDYSFEDKDYEESEIFTFLDTWKQVGTDQWQVRL